MSKISKILMISVLAVFLAAGSVMAIPQNAALEGVFNGIATDGINDVNVYTDMLSDDYDSTWMLTASGTSAATFIIELAGYAASNTFGVYDNGFYVEIFSGSDAPGNKASFSLNLDGSVAVNGVIQDGVTFTGNSFGYYIDSPDGLFHSDTDLNADGFDHMFAYQGVGETVQLPNSWPAPWTDNEYILAFEDLYNGGDQDFTDLVVMVESVQPVPEPATMFLLGSGLIGLAGFGRKKFFNKAA